jgi:hypothetical protein
MSVVFSDIQNYLDAILAKNGSTNPAPHGVFWRQTNNYDKDYASFTNGEVPGVGIPIMNIGSPLNSNFYLILVNPNVFPASTYGQMPVGGPFITDKDYSATVKGAVMTGDQIQNAITTWLKTGFHK